MRILHLLDIPWWSGLAAYAFDCMAAHRDAGHEVRIACDPGSLPHKKALEMNFMTEETGGRKAVHAPGNFLAVGNAIGRARPDWIVAHTGSSHWIACAWGRIKNIPVIRTRALSQAVKPGFLNRTLYAHSRWIVTGSARLKTECLEKLKGLPENRVAVLPPPVDLPDIPGGAPSHSGKIGVLARLDPVKGHGVLLQAFQEVQKKFPAAELHFAGPEENVSWGSLLRKAGDLGLRNVFYHGFLEREKCWEFLRSCGTGAIPSLGSEEISRALLEWMACGKPVAASAVGAIPEILKEGENGCLAAPGDPDALAGKLEWLLENPERALALGRNNRALCVKNFSRKNFQARWEELLRNP